LCPRSVEESVDRSYVCVAPNVGVLSLALMNAGFVVAAGHGLTADVMRARISALGGSACVAAFDRALQSHCSVQDIPVLPESPSQALCDLALCDLPSSVACQAALARCAALTELVFGVQGGPATSACVAMWLKQLSRVEAALVRTLRTLEAQSSAWQAAQANLARADDTSAAQLSLFAALASSDKFRNFVEGIH
jgi:hypothetical protein